mmetsp:Transcript_47964/g.116799  ORF Transcript_47964/g.116799 Transcript_47964/m.116799 type:complete len:229 (-) Transcript_47964:568-1254(-)
MQRVRHVSVRPIDPPPEQVGEAIRQTLVRVESCCGCGLVEACARLLAEREPHDAVVGLFGEGKPLGKLGFLHVRLGPVAGLVLRLTHIEGAIDAQRHSRVPQVRPCPPHDERVQSVEPYDPEHVPRLNERLIHGHVRDRTGGHVDVRIRGEEVEVALSGGVGNGHALESAVEEQSCLVQGLHRGGDGLRKAEDTHAILRQVLRILPRPAPAHRRLARLAHEHHLPRGS